MSIRCVFRSRTLNYLGSKKRNLTPTLLATCGRSLSQRWACCKVYHTSMHRPINPSFWEWDSGHGYTDVYII